jgi:cytosine/adenosine deaminase-related metal-dependent hydrolase
LATFISNGLKVGLGSDSVASNNASDILEEARFAILLSRAGGDTLADGGWINAQQALLSATTGGARALGLEDQIGSLAEGLQADLTVVALDGSHQLPLHDSITALVFASSGCDVRLTVVAGKEVYREGRVVTVDEERLRTRVSEVAAKLRA